MQHGRLSPSDQPASGAFEPSGTDIAEALRRGAIVAHLQPVVCLADGRVLGFEALARWHDDCHGWIPPATFVPIAERAGIVAELDLAVLRNACQAIAVMHRGGARAISIAANLSSLTLARPDIADRVVDIIQTAGLRCDAVWIEATETALMADGARATVARLEKAGIRLALDDFGVMYASLQYVLTLRAHELKIDRSFVADVEHDRAAAAIVRCVVGLGSELGMRVVAEGVETAGQEAALRRLGVTVAQGYRYGRPLPALDAQHLVSSPARPPALDYTDQNETRRVALVEALDPEGAAEDPTLAAAVRIIAEASGAPIALVSMLDADRQWFPARVGLDVRSTPRAVAFCDHTIRRPTPTVIANALEDDRFARNPLVLGAPHLRFYAGVPLLTADGLAVGALCIADTRPRSLSAHALSMMEHTAALVALHLQHRLSRSTLGHREEAL